MRKIVPRWFNALPFLALVLTFTNVKAQTATNFQITLQNVVQTTDRILEFDIYLQNNDLANSMELATFQAGITLNSAIYSGGILTASIVAGTSTLTNSAQMPTSITYTSSSTIIKLAAKSPPGSGSGSIISQVSPGTRIIRVRLTSTVAFAANSTPNFFFAPSTDISPSYPTAVALYVGGLNTQLPVTMSVNAFVLENPSLNKLPTAFTVTGTGSYCQGSGGLTVGLTGSENGVTYTLLKNGSASSTLPGTGSPIIFTNQLFGTYTVSGTNGGGTTAMTGSANITEISSVPVSISIVASSNPVCAGSSVTFTATPTYGGTTPAYQWKVNGGNIGSNNTNYTYTPANGDIVTCVLTSNTTCPTGNPATSNAITMIVNTNLPVSVSIVASSNPVCTGSSVTFTATPTNGGTTPAYQWKVNSGNVGPNNTNYTYTPANGDMVTCVLTSNSSCATGNPATSNVITMTVNANLPVSVSIIASSNPVCAGSSVTFTATPTNGGTTPAYQWKVNGGNVGSNNANYIYTPANGDIVNCVLTSNSSCATGNPATSNAITMIVNTNLPVSVSIVASSNPVCTGSSVTFTATPTNGGTTPAYQWKVNGGNVGSNNANYTYTPANGDIVTCVLTSNTTCPTGNPATSNAITMIVNTNLPVSVSIIASSNPVCAGSSVTFTATPTNGGTTPAYQWKVNGGNVGSNNVNYTYTPVNGDIVTCVLTSNSSCATGNPATSNAITMTVNANLPVSVSIIASSNPVCAGSSVTFTATPTNGGTTPAYQWKVNSGNVGPNNTNYTYTPANGDMVTCVLTSNSSCATGNPATSNAITVTVNVNHPVSVSIVASSNPVCTGSSVTFTATPTNGGTTPAYQWKVNGGNIGSNNANYTYTPANGDIISCILTSNATCPIGNPATSNAITMTVNTNLPVNISIGASANPVCAGTSVTFNATPTNGGTSPAYQWKVNGINAGTNNAVYTYSPTSGDAVTCTLTSNSTCATGNPATSNTITLTVNPIPSAPTIGTITQPTCAVATGSVILNGLPAGNWTINPGSIAGTGITYTISGLIAGTYAYTVTSASGCTSPASGSVVINAQPVTPVIPTQTTTATPGSPFIYPPTGGTIPAGTTYTWPAPAITGGVTGGAASIGSQLTINGTLNIPSGTGTAIYTVTPTSLAGCVGANFTVTVNVTSSCVPVTVAIQPSNGTACATSGSATFTVVASGTGPFTYQWQYFNGISWANVGNGTPAGAVYTNATTATMSVTGITTAAVYQYHCLITNCSGGNTATSNTATFTVLALPVPTLTSSDANNIFCLGTSVTFTAGGGGVGAIYDFRVNGATVQIGPTTTYTTTSLANSQTVTVVVTNANLCSATSAGIANFVNQPPSIYISTPAACSTDFLTYSVGVTVGSGTVTCNVPTAVVTNPSLNIWIISGVSAGVPVIVTVTDINVCQNTITVNAPNCLCPVVLAPVSGGNKSYCTGGVIPTLTATVLAGETVDWYDSSSGGNQLLHQNVSYTPTGPGTYYAMARNTTSNCVSSTRTPIVLTMNALPIPTLTSSDADNIFCSGTSVTFTATGGTNYNFFVGGISQQNGALATYTTTTLTNGQAVSVIVTNTNGCTAPSAAITNTVNPTPTPTLTSSDADNIFCAGTSITFAAGGGATYDFRVGGISMQNGASTTYTTSLLTNGQVVNVIVSNANGCSATSPSITNTVNPIPTPTLTSSDADNIFCAGTSVIFTAGGGTNYNFRIGGVSVQNSISNTYTTTALTNGQVVDVIVSNSVGCALTSAAITNTVNPQPTANAGAGGDVCGLSFTLSSHASIGIGTWTKTTGIGTATFTPNANSPSATVTVSDYGTYTFTWTEVSGSCTSSSVVTVNFYLQPVANAGTGGNNCGMGFRFNASLNAGVGTWTKVSGPGTVIFSPDANTATALATVSAFGSYTFRWSVDNGTCSNSATVAVVFIQEAAANAGLGGNSCDKTFTLGALVPATGIGTWTKSVGPGIATFTPDSHQANAKVTVDQFGTYTFAWTVVNSTCTSSDIGQVVFHNLPPINAGRDTALCKGGSVQFHAVGTGTVYWTPVVLVSNPNIINPTVTPDTTTIFTVNLTDQFGCKNSDNIVVEVRNKTVADAGPDQVLGYVFTTTMNANLGHTYETGVWSLISGTGKFSDSTFSKTEVNSLSAGENNFLWTVKNGYCPVSHDSVSIKVNDFVIPTLITPNMDGKNDYFVLRGLTTTLGKTELIIFDRRGAMVYKNLNYDNLWNGVDYNKNPLPDDTYFYVIKTSSGKSISGYIVIRR